MVSPDLVRTALACPLDWVQFEQIVCEILAEDDFPNLRQMGGGGDEGVDAVDESFYDSESRIKAVIQITSQRSQKRKLTLTIKRLKETGKQFDQLVIVFRHPIDSAVKRELVNEAFEQKVLADIRDEDYLVRRLAQPKSGIFKRYFSNVRAQLASLLNEEDPLGAASDGVRHAMLASIAAFVINPSSSNARMDLFDQSVLAVLVAEGGSVDIESLQTKLTKLLPANPIDRARIMKSLARLETAGQCILENGNPGASETAVGTIGATIKFMSEAMERIREKVLADVTLRVTIDDATKGRIERNVKRALIQLFRIIGPTTSPSDDLCDHLASTDPLVASALSNQLTFDVAHLTITALNAFARDPDNTEILAKLARSYAAFELRNIDPLAREFQQTALSRPMMILDTDAILFLAIEELPEHRPIVDSLRALHKRGVRIILPRQLLQEALDHIGRGHRTYKRFAASLERLPEEYVDAEVWHAAVRGFYYFLPNNPHESFYSYLRRYYDPESPMEYLSHHLRKMVGFEVLEEIPIDSSDRSTLDTILPHMLARKERQRWKAEFRDDNMMQQRLEYDLKCALFAAKPNPDATIHDAQAYLVSLDSAFVFLQTIGQWKDRPRVLLRTTNLPRMTEHALGVPLHDDDIVRIVFDPVHVAAAEQIAGDIEELAKAGVNLRNESLSRLEWDVAHDLRSALLKNRDAQKQAESVEARLESGIELSQAADDLGYPLDSEMHDIVESYRNLKQSLEREQDRRVKAEEIAACLINAASGLTKKGKRRVAGILHEIGGLPENYDDAVTEN